MKNNTATVTYERAFELSVITRLGLPLADAVDCALAILKASLTDHRVASDLGEFFDTAITIAFEDGAVNPDNSLIFISGHGYA